jgi:pre-mRNA-splicing helicase BRR2
MVDKCMWASMNPLRQFKQIPDYVLSRLEKKEQFSWEAFYQMTPQEIGELTKFPKLGKILHKFVHQVPRVELDAYAQPITRNCLRVDLNIKIDFRW